MNTTAGETKSKLSVTEGTGPSSTAFPMNMMTTEPVFCKKNWRKTEALSPMKYIPIMKREIKSGAKNKMKKTS